MNTPQVELLWWAGCPSTERALAELRGVMAELGLAAAEVKVIEVGSEEQAREREFHGSPTILIDGQDPFAGDGEEEVGLSCRVYRRRDGRVSPTPDPEDLRDALQGARR
jgi:glutaredoxin